MNLKHIIKDENESIQDFFKRTIWCDHVLVFKNEEERHKEGTKCEHWTTETAKEYTDTLYDDGSFIPVKVNMTERFFTENIDVCPHLELVKAELDVNPYTGKSKGMKFDCAFCGETIHELKGDFK